MVYLCVSLGRNLLLKMKQFFLLKVYIVVVVDFLVVEEEMGYVDGISFIFLCLEDQVVFRLDDINFSYLVFLVCYNFLVIWCCEFVL